jgi:hypothetical protein
MAFFSKSGLALLAGMAVAIVIAVHFAAMHARETVHERLREGGYLTNEVMRLCTPERVLEFKLGSKSFFMKWAWVREEIARYLWTTGHRTCPSSPIEVGGFFLRFPGSVARERDLNLYTIEFSIVNEQTLFDKHEIPTNPQTRIPDATGYVDDITEVWQWGLPDLSGTDHHPRYYRLQHPPRADGTKEPAILMWCSGNSGEAGGRMCFTRYHYEDLAIEYRFWPKDGKGPNNYLDRQLKLPPGPSEPDGLLSGDARVRQWIEDLQHRPISPRP